jgi:hypothetical protein
MEEEITNRVQQFCFCTFGAAANYLLRTKNLAFSFRKILIYTLALGRVVYFFRSAQLENATFVIHRSFEVEYKKSIEI